MQITTFLTHKQVACWNFTVAEKNLLEQLVPEATVQICADTKEFLSHLPHTEIALVWRFSQEWFRLAPLLHWIATPAAGMDYFQVSPPAGVSLTYGRFHGRIMGETVVGMMLAGCRGILDCATWTGADQWPKGPISTSMRLLRGSHVVIVGFGHIGAWIGRLAKPFGARITGIKRNAGIPHPDYFDTLDQIVEIEQLDRILPTADHLVLALPGTPETTDLFDASRLALLPSTAAVYNVGRGNAVDEQALARALNQGRIARACLDVFRDEPLPPTNPLRSCPNLVIMPHASAIAPNYMELFCREFAEDYAQRSMSTTA